MTAQISDRFFYDGNEFAIVGLAGQRLLTPADFDITATAIGATCWRGYYATYAAVDDGLMALVEFVVRAKNDRYPPITGKRAHGRAEKATTDADSPPDLMRWVEDCFSLDYDL